MACAMGYPWVIHGLTIGGKWVNREIMGDPYRLIVGVPWVTYGEPWASTTKSWMAAEKSMG